MTQDFAGRVAFVTGGASGIGAAASRLFAARGASVAIVDRNEAGIAALAEELRSAGAKAHAIAADLSAEADVERAVAETVAVLGGLDCAFNNAGVGSDDCAMDQLSLDKWAHIIGVNLTGVFLCMKHQLRHMAGQGRGAIVNTSSGAGLIPAPLGSAYTAAKHGVLGLTKVAAREYAPRGIRVNAVCPGLIETPMARNFAAPGSEMERVMLSTMPSGRFGDPREVAEVAVWLCSDAATFVSGDSIVVDGGGLCR